MTQLFTPRTNDFVRLTMRISDEDRAKMPERGLGWRAEITDQTTGKRYRIRGAACGLSCQCDAAIVKELP